MIPARRRSFSICLFCKNLIAGGKLFLACVAFRTMRIMSEVMEEYYLVAAGGIAGTCARYVLNVIIPAMPGILVINVAGCFLLGLVMYLSSYGGVFGPRTRITCGAGFIGSFTTFSTFSLQTFQASPGIAVANVVISVLLGLAAVMAGRQVAIKLAKGR
jgi:Integral membrane protein possibly involved in chromosome condensation